VGVTELKFLAVPPGENCGEEVDALIVFEWVFEDDLMHFLGCLAYQIAQLEGRVVVCTEEQSDVLDDKTSHLDHFSLFQKAAVFRQFFYFLDD